MIERGQGAGFALKSREGLVVLRHGLGQHLQSYVASQLRVAGAVHLAHTALPDLGEDLIRADLPLRGSCAGLHILARNLHLGYSARNRLRADAERAALTLLI